MRSQKLCRDANNTANGCGATVCAAGGAHRFSSGDHVSAPFARERDQSVVAAFVACRIWMLTSDKQYLVSMYCVQI